jgi:cytidine deaminase
MTDDELRTLLQVASAAQARAHAPYSRFQVGAAVLSSSGQVFAGCNVENASYGATLCAERVAIGAMIAAGERKLKAVAVFTTADPPAMPCGICRQVLLEFDDQAVVVVSNGSQVQQIGLRELLPAPFQLDP